ncbi:hypothetical protein [Nonomuraea basaltis]|uniref:hypothetical protein n=1 Tax=Nonomuraea basaltis TaxID=2495887 RepID=UPI00110C6F2B|nr:hypothetical protein [Nonomuraea basaltis]TMR92972.1 hypothetical protein EJK15_41785 [Nonomuraea basaltis]
MDVQTEVLDLKLRVADLESGAHGAVPDWRTDLLREINDRTKHLRSEITALKARLAEARTELSEDLAAVQTEIEGVRREVSARPARPGDEDADLRLDMAEEFAALRAEMAHQFDSVRSEVLDLGIKIDRLLKRDACH